MKRPTEQEVAEFERARKLYPAPKLGLQVELDHFIKKHKNWREIIPLLEPAIKRQILWRQNAKDQWRPRWKHFQSWLNNKYWTLDVGEQPEKLQRCFRCSEPATKQYNHKSGQLDMCEMCHSLLLESRPFVTHLGKTVKKWALDISQLEIMIEKQKAKR
jgi:hypothetical protein